VKRRDFIHLLAAGALTPSVSWGAARKATTVRGRVMSGAKPLARVTVSNGRELTQTDAHGRYRLPMGPDGGRFVFVCCPRGYWTDDFYYPIEAAARKGKADFSLHPVMQKDRFDFVFAADLSNLGSPEQKTGRAKTKASFEEICGLLPKPAFLWIQGDLGIRPDKGAAFLDCLKKSTVPTRVGIGNHEIMPDQANPKALYENLFGPTYYSFDWGPVHFIVLDGNKPAPGIPGRSQGTVEPREMAWLRADLASQPRGKPIIVGVHIPIVSTYPARRPDLKETEAPFWQSANGKRLTSLFSRYRVRLVLQGHIHENERITQGGVEYVESVSLCGRWWKSGEGFERATDGTPRGYRIVSVDGDRIRHRYQSSCESRVERRGEFLKLPARLGPCESESFLFTCYDAPNGSHAWARVDRGPWLALSQVVLKKAKVKKPHHWQGKLDAARLSSGRHTIEVRTTWPDGTVVSEARSFAVEGNVGDEEKCGQR
jgi:hypothetical protein